MSPATSSLDAGERLRRLLAILAWLARVGHAPLEDLARRFDIDRDALVAELELAACCGRPPYTPDQLLELVVDEDEVFAYGLEPLRRLPRLTPEEGFSLAAAVRGMLAVEGADETPLRSALAKLETALGAAPLVVELELPPHTVELRELAARGEAVEIAYHGAGDDSPRARRVEPYAVVTREGRYYLDAFCSLAGDWRRFRIDRIESVRRLSEPVAPRTPPPELAGERAFAGGGSTWIARLSVGASDAALLAAYAIAEPVARPDGRVEVTLEIADERFLGRLLLQLGTDAEVLEPAELADAARDEARRALRRYARRRTGPRR